MAKQKNNQDQEQKEQPNNSTRFIGLGFQMLVTIGLGVFVGVKLDEQYPNQYSTFSIIFSFAAIALALYSVIKKVGQH